MTKKEARFELGAASGVVTSHREDGGTAESRLLEVMQGIVDRGGEV